MRLRAGEERREINPLEDWDYAPIGDYAAIGDCRTIALVSKQGSIDWLCLPHFSSPSMFAALLDRRRGGRFAIRPRDIAAVERRYVGDTNVLETTFRCARGAVRLTDLVTLLDYEGGRGVLQPEHQLVRIVECVSGEVDVDVIYQPRPDYARYTPKLVQRGKLGWLCKYCGHAAYLVSDAALAAADEGTLGAAMSLAAGERRHFLFTYSQHGLAVIPPPRAAAEIALQSTLRSWEAWSRQCLYTGPYRSAVMRSALALKLLTYSLSGAVIAASTTSLPEGHSGARNWDYRYCWLRDTSLVLQSFIDLGFEAESEAFLGWLLHATRLTQPQLQVVYDVYGETALIERELAHLEGYRGARPVRVGNGAHRQLQLDVYGDVVMTACSFIGRGGVLDRYDRKLLVGFGRAVSRLWREPDHGIWEIRGPPRHNTYSKLMCWTALDRLLDLHERGGLRIEAAAVRREREVIRADIDRNAYDSTLGSYVGYYGGDEPDASLLLLARYGYIEPDDPRMEGTCRYIERRLAVDGFLYRYPPRATYDGIATEDHLFAICTCWLIDYMARAGRLEDAVALFERLLALGNDVGLYAEEFDAGDKSPLGNFPQAFTHVGLITAALAIQQAEQGKRGREIAQ
jgi:GH15 family glucan-1,4-alpha-glucosidase